MEFCDRIDHTAKIKLYIFALELGYTAQNMEKISTIDIFHQEIDVVLIGEGAMQFNKKWRGDLLHEFFLVNNKILQFLLDYLLLVDELQCILLLALVLHAENLSQHTFSQHVLHIETF